MEEFYKAIDEVVSCIKDSLEYQNCMKIREKMSHNSEVMNLISDIKELQKQYIRSSYNKDIKKELDYKKKKLESIPIYVIYLQNLEVVNEKIEYVKDSLNDYFYQLFNEEKKEELK